LTGFAPTSRNAGQENTNLHPIKDMTTSGESPDQALSQGY
jgi:hypothetical protein